MAANKRGGTIAQIVGLIDGNTRESSGSISAHSKNVFVTRVPGSEVRASASAAFPALWIGADNMTLGSTHAALTWGAGGRDIAVAPLGEFNSLHKDSPVIHAHSKEITEMQWSTVEPNLLASASQDGFVKLWRMPASLSALPELAPIASISVSSSASANINARALSLSCHPLNHEQLAVASTEAAEHSASVWNVDTGAMQTRLTGHTDSIMSVRWSAGGNLLATCAKDRMVHIYEPRAATSPVAKVTAHDSALPSRLIWLPPLAGASDSAHFISIGYSRQRALHVSIWDIRSLEQPLHTRAVPTTGNCVGLPMVHYCPVSQLLTVAQKGDKNMFFFDIQMIPEPHIFFLNSYVSAQQQIGFSARSASESSADSSVLLRVAQLLEDRSVQLLRVSRSALQHGGAPNLSRSVSSVAATPAETSPLKSVEEVDEDADEESVAPSTPSASSVTSAPSRQPRSSVANLPEILKQSVLVEQSEALKQNAVASPVEITTRAHARNVSVSVKSLPPSFYTASSTAQVASPVLSPSASIIEDAQTVQFEIAQVHTPITSPLIAAAIPPAAPAEPEFVEIQRGRRNSVPNRQDAAAVMALALQSSPTAEPQRGRRNSIPDRQSSMGESAMPSIASVLHSVLQSDDFDDFTPPPPLVPLPHLPDPLRKSIISGAQLHHVIINPVQEPIAPMPTSLPPAPPRPLSSAEQAARVADLTEMIGRLRVESQRLTKLHSVLLEKHSSALAQVKTRSEALGLTPPDFQPSNLFELVEATGTSLIQLQAESTALTESIERHMVCTDDLTRRVSILHAQLRLLNKAHVALPFNAAANTNTEVARRIIAHPKSLSPEFLLVGAPTSLHDAGLKRVALAAVTAAFEASLPAAKHSEAATVGVAAINAQIRRSRMSSGGASIKPAASDRPAEGCLLDPRRVQLSHFERMHELIYLRTAWQHM